MTNREIEIRKAKAMTAKTKDDNYDDNYNYKVNVDYPGTAWPAAEPTVIQEGTTATPYGFVRLTITPWSSRLDFIWQGRVYYRSWRGRTFSRRYMVTLARRFVDDVVGADHDR